MSDYVEISAQSKLKIDPKWNYAAKDSTGEWFLYTNKPYTDTITSLWNVVNGYSKELNGYSLDFEGDWKDSLHKIIEGKFIRIKNVWVPKTDYKVMVSSNGYDFYRRYSTGKLNKNEHLLCYEGGYSSWTAHYAHPWEYWREPTTEELKSRID